MKRISRIPFHTPVIHVLIFSVIIIASIFGFLISRDNQPKTEAHSEIAETNFWETNGAARDIKIGDDGKIWLVGLFTSVGPNTGSGVPISLTTGLAEPTFPQINGLSSFSASSTVYSVVSDGLGGWYIGGTFQYIDDTPINRIAHILNNGTLDPAFNPNADGAVLDMYLSGTTLYIGGSFTTIRGATRNRLAAIDTTTGLLTSWNPNSNGVVYTITEDSGDIYIGGSFTTMGGITRNYLAAVDATTGALEAWNPNTNARVNKLDIEGGLVYVGGIFTTIGGITRNRLAAINATTGTLEAWNPNSSAEIYTLDADGAVVYVGSGFFTIGGVTRRSVAAIDTTTGLLTSWNPNIDTNSISVRTIISSGGLVYIGGSFSAVGADIRNNLAAIDATTGIATSWNPNAEYTVYTTAISGTLLYAGGNFGSVNGTERNRIAAIDPSTGLPTSCNPNANGVVYKMIFDGTTLYIAGDFTTIGGVTRNRIAAIDTTTCTLTSWNPNSNNGLRTLAQDASNIYVGGFFTTIDGVSRNRAAAFSKSTGAITSWNPNVANGTVADMDVENGIVYLAGSFTTVSATARNRLAAVTDAGVLTSWNPGITSGSVVNSIDATASSVFIGGLFSAFGATTRNNAAELNLTTGAPTSWNPNASSSVNKIFLDGDNIYVGGNFSAIGGSLRKIAVFDSTTGSLHQWSPFTYGIAGSDIYSISVDNNNLYVSGNFSQVNNENRNFFAVFGPVSVEFSSASSSGSEVTTPANISVQLENETVDDVTVDYTITGGTATGGGVDYTLANGTVTIPTNSTSVNIPITIVNDLLDENNETITLELSNPTEAILGTNTTHTFTITDDEVTPTVQFTATSSSGAEGTTAVNIEATISEVSGRDVGFDFALSGGTAADGTDFTIESASPFTIPAGSTTGNISVTVTDDAIFEDNETLILTMSNPTNSTLGANTTHTYTITNNDSVPEVEFSATSASGNEGVTPVTIEVSLSNPSENEITVAFATDVLSTATGGGTDYTISTASPLTIPAGSTTANISVAITDDVVYEANETLILNLSGPTNANLGVDTQFTYTITNDDTVEVQFTATESSAGEETTPSNIEVSLSQASLVDVTVNFAVLGTSTATGGGTDYSVLTSSPITITAGNTTADISASIIDDAIFENDETIILNLSGPTNAILGANTTHTYTITNNDATPDVEFSTTSASGNESVTPVTIEVSLSNPSENAITVAFATDALSTATGGGTDYTISTASPLTIPAGSTTANISVAITGDAVYEANETLILNLSGPTNANLGIDTQFTYTINNDDVVEIQFTATESSGGEATTPANIEVSLSQTSLVDVTVDFAVLGGSTATGGGTDYSVLTSSPITITAGNTTADISASIVDDAIFENDETIILELSGPTNAILGANTTHTYTITNNDATPDVEFTIDSSSNNENISPVTIEVSLSNPTINDVTADFTITGGNATETDDYSVTTLSPITILAGATTTEIELSIINDDLNELDETVILELSNPTNANIGANSEHTYTITNDEAGIEVQFTLTSGEDTEATTPVDIEVELSGVSSRDTTVEFAVAEGATATEIEDFTLPASPLTILAGETTGTISIEIIEDAIDENDEAFTLELSNPTESTLGANTQFTYTITNNEPAPGLNFTVIDDGNEEDAVTNLDIEVSMSETNFFDVTVDFAITGDSTADEGSDFTVITASPLTIPAGETTANIELTIIGDTQSEDDETVIIELSNPVEAALGPNTIFTYTIINDDGGISVPVYMRDVSQPLAEDPRALSPYSIRWNFKDTADNETGFGLIEIIDGRERLITDTGEIITTNLSYFIESGLEPSTEYCDRNVVAFNGARTSRATVLPCATTLAAPPPPSENESGSSSESIVTGNADITLSQDIYFISNDSSANMPLARSDSKAQSAAGISMIIMFVGFAHATTRRKKILGFAKHGKILSVYLMISGIAGIGSFVMLNTFSSPTPSLAEGTLILSDTTFKKDDVLMFEYNITNNGITTAEDIWFTDAPNDAMTIDYNNIQYVKNFYNQPVTLQPFINNGSFDVYLGNLAKDESIRLTYEVTINSHYADFDHIGSISGKNFENVVARRIPIHVNTTETMIAPNTTSVFVKPFMLIKGRDFNTVYMIDADYKRRPFENPITFFSWYPGFDGVIEITAEDMAQIQLGLPMDVRSGTWLIKTVYNSSVYAIEPNGILRWIPNEAGAIRIYGPNWNQKILDINELIFARYTIGTSLKDNEYPSGTLFNDGMRTCYVSKETCRVVSENGFYANRFQNEFVQTASSDVYSRMQTGAPLIQTEKQLLTQ